MSVATIQSGTSRRLRHNTRHHSIHHIIKPTKNKNRTDTNNTGFLILALLLVAAIIKSIDRWLFKQKRIRRRDYYRNVYLRSEAWRRKRYVVLKRDDWRCVYCGAPAAEVHHNRYARNIGNEPIKWLVSVCKTCHEAIHYQP
ncbi:MAG: hypothetical protein JWR50_3607 [Mucilaginibacter sp.]|nr:hypothetical protein [Mucilaginibacter sp.]